MTAVLENPLIDFYRYPPIGGDDWAYAFESAQAKALETHMISHATFTDMANASDFEEAAEFLRPTEYALPNGAISALDGILMARRSALRELFAGWMHNKRILSLFKARDDFANLRLAVRRAMTKRAIGTDYSSDGNFPPEQLAEVFENEKYEMLPGYMADAAERAVVMFYSDKDIRSIDYAIDAAQGEYELTQAAKLKSDFLLGLFRIKTDMGNIRTMMRLRFRSAESKNVFLAGGYVERDKLLRGLEAAGENLAALFFATPYFEIVQAGAAYAAAEKSFLKIEQQCDDYFTGFLRTTISIAVGPQPVIAYFLEKENEIRKVRLVTTARKNNLNPKLVLDRI